MTTAIENATYKLTAIYDLREWDEAAECYMDILPEQKSTCAHCGKLHAKVYEVTRTQDGAIFQVGSSCSKKLFNWQPEQEEVKRLTKEATKLAKDKAHQKLVDIAAPIAQEIASMAVPQIVQVDTKHYPSGDIPVYGMAGSRVQVYCREGLTEERRLCCIEAWKREQVDVQLEVLYPPTSELYAEDKNAKMRYKVTRIAYGQLVIW